MSHQRRSVGVSRQNEPCDFDEQLRKANEMFPFLKDKVTSTKKKPLVDKENCNENIATPRATRSRSKAEKSELVNEQKSLVSEEF